MDEEGQGPRAQTVLSSHERAGNGTFGSVDARCEPPLLLLAFVIFFFAFGL